MVGEKCDSNANAKNANANSFVSACLESWAKDFIWFTACYLFRHSYGHHAAVSKRFSHKPRDHPHSGGALGRSPRTCDRGQSEGGHDDACNTA